LDLFHPEVVAHWNGAQVAGNRAELEAWFKGGLVGSTARFRIEKRLILAEGDWVGVQWRHFATYKDGREVEGVGNEFWRTRDGRAIEWNAVGVEFPAG
jgi:ketosteroid isomerase-like protein